MAKMKVNAQDIVALSKKEGFLAKQLYVVFTTPTKGIEPVMKVVKEHLEFQVALENRESCLLRGWHASRMMIVQTDFPLKTFFCKDGSGIGG